MLQTWFLSSKQPFQKQIDCTLDIAPNCQIEAGSCFGFAKPRYYYYSEKKCRCRVNIYPRGQNRPGKDLILPAEQIFQI